LLGLLKMFTFGFFGVLYWVDLILIAMQILGPQDGSNYVVGPWGPRFFLASANNLTILYLGS